MDSTTPAAAPADPATATLAATPPPPPATPATTSTLQQIEATAKEIETEVVDGAKQAYAVTTSAASSLFGLINPRWKQFAADWRVWDWTKRVAVVGLAALFAWVGIHWGFGFTRVIGGGFEAAHAYSHGQVVTKADLDKKADKTELQDKADAAALTAAVEDLGAKDAALSAEIDAMKQRLDEKQPATPAKPPSHPTKKRKSAEAKPFWSF